ncbi:protein kintoun [Anoplolepis gracilipes]|uniref:protein kintoun n=1 Tax=Anoplolepis gracilipes TaxID=354296 RepID=UPI003BA02A09
MDVYESRKKDWEDLEVSREELENITECLKKEEFRKLLIEYAEEVTDPDNKKIYEKEITQLEKERGVDVTFVNPEPGYVIKTSVNGDRKCFLNISKNAVVGRPTSQPSYEQGHRGLQWSIPYTLIPPRDDFDKRNARCMVFDVVFHPDTIYLASKNARFREIVNNTAMDGVENNFKVKLDRKNLKFPKINFKGITHPTVIRKPSKEPPKESLDIEPEIYQKLMASYDESREKLKKKEEKPQRASPVTTYYKDKQYEPMDEKYVDPKFSIKHQFDVEMEDFILSKDAKMYAAIPKKFVITIDLPLLKSASDATLDIHEQSLTLKSEKPAKYLLELPLPYPVDGDNGNAKFDAKYKKLIITLPVIRPSIPMDSIDRPDSGVESDQSSPLFVASKDDEKSLLKIELMKEDENKCKSLEFDKTSDVIDECEDTALRTCNIENIDTFMNPNIKYNLPPYTCNIYNNQLAVTVNVKNVNPNEIYHKILNNNAGIHILLTSIGAGFFPQYYSLCLKIGDGCIEPESLTIEPWDNNVVFNITVQDIENVTRYYVGMDTEFMEVKDLPTSASFTNKFKELMVCTKDEPRVERQFYVHPQGDSVIIDIRPNQQDSDDDEEQENARVIKQQQEKMHTIEKSRSVSESSGDELASSNGSVKYSKGILKSHRSRDFSRSMSESSADENSLPTSCTDYHYDFIHDVNSESDCSSLKKTVRFNDVVSRQLYRSNSSILGQRKKNQRKLRNKKRAHDRRMSESENSETEERDKYKTHYKRSPNEETSEIVKPILTRDKQYSQQQKTANIEIAKSKTDDIHSLHQRNKSSFEEKLTEDVQADDSNNATKDAVQLEFKNDLIFDLDM